MLSDFKIFIESALKGQENSVQEWSNYCQQAVLHREYVTAEHLSDTYTKEQVQQALQQLEEQITLALEMIDRALAQDPHHHCAGYLKGQWYEYNNDLINAAKYYDHAILQQHIQAKKRRAILYMKGEGFNIDAGLKLYDDLVESGDLDAIRIRAEYYVKGVGERNFDKAIKLYELSIPKCSKDWIAKNCQEEIEILRRISNLNNLITNYKVEQRPKRVSSKDEAISEIEKVINLLEDHLKQLMSLESNGYEIICKKEFNCDYEAICKKSKLFLDCLKDLKKSYQAKLEKSSTPKQIRDAVNYFNLRCKNLFNEAQNLFENEFGWGNYFKKQANALSTIVIELKTELERKEKEAIHTKFSPELAARLQQQKVEVKLKVKKAVPKTEVKPPEKNIKTRQKAQKVEAIPTENDTTNTDVTNNDPSSNLDARSDALIVASPELRLVEVIRPVDTLKLIIAPIVVKERDTQEEKNKAPNENNNIKLIEYKTDVALKEMDANVEGLELKENPLFNNPGTNAVLSLTHPQIIQKDKTKLHNASVSTEHYAKYVKELRSKTQTCKDNLTLNNENKCIHTILETLLSQLDKGPTEATIRGFYKILNRKEQGGKERNLEIIEKNTERSTARFIAGIALITATIVTGVIPGLITMAVVYALTHKTPMTFFQPHSTKFKEDITQIKNDFDHDAFRVSL